MKHPSSSIRSATQATAPDILLIIAHQAASYNRPWDTKIILKLSHVCRHWRHALISFPILWNKINLPRRKLAFLDLLLNRSADYPLEVRIRFDSYCSLSDDLSRSCDLISGYVHRIRTLTIQAIPAGSFNHFEVNFEPYLDLVLSLFKKPAPMLVSFNIDSYDVGLPDWFLKDIAMAPNLKKLQAEHLSISYQLPILKTVTHLCLKDVRGLTSVHCLLSLLEGASKCLEVLILSRLLGFESQFLWSSSDGDIQGPNNNHVPIHFSYLKILDLDLEPKALMAVLGHITTPSHVNWKIHCHHALSMNLNFDITPLLAFFKNVRTGPYLLMDWLNDGYLDMQFAQDPFSPPNVRLKAGITGEILSEAKEPIHRFKSLLMNLHLSDVYFCEIDCRRFKRKERYMKDYRKVLGSLFLPFLQLEKLIIRCVNNEILYQFATQLQLAFGTSILPCPLLNELKIGFVDDNTRIEKLIQVLRERKKASGHVLKDLHIGVNRYHATTRKEHNILQQIFENVAENVAIYDIPSTYSVFTRKFDNTY